MDWKKMVRTCVMVSLILWLLTLVGGVGGGLINLPLVIAAFVLILDLVTGRRTVA